MENIRQILLQVNIVDLIKLFNIQVSIAIFLIFLIFRGLFSKIIVKVVFLIKGTKENISESKLYKIFYNFFLFLGIYLTIITLKPSAKVLMVVNTIFHILCIFFITNTINSFITQDSKWLKKYTRYSRNEVLNNFICKLIRGIIWIIAIYIIVKVELGFDLTGLVAGFGIRKCYNFTCSTRYSKKFIKWSNNSYRQTI